MFQTFPSILTPFLLDCRLKVPSFCICSNMDILLLLCNQTISRSFVFFLFVYMLAYFVIFRTWGPKHRTEASSCFMSLAHGTPAVIMAVHALLQTQSTPTFASPNSVFDNRVLEYSMGYFLMDLVHYMVFFPRDILFVLHHLATLYVLATCRYMVHYGAYGILVLLILAEVTSPCQNVWSVAGFRKAEVPAAARLHEFMSPPFYALYSVVRGVLGPIWVLKMGVFYLSGAADGLIPGWAWISWMVVIGTAILVSILWVSNHSIDWCKERRYYEAQKKVR